MEEYGFHLKGENLPRNDLVNIIPTLLKANNFQLMVCMDSFAYITEQYGPYKVTTIGNSFPSETSASGNAQIICNQLEHSGLSVTYRVEKFDIGYIVYIDKKWSILPRDMVTNIGKMIVGGLAIIGGIAVVVSILERGNRRA